MIHETIRRIRLNEIARSIRDRAPRRRIDFKLHSTLLVHIDPHDGDRKEFTRCKSKSEILRAGPIIRMFDDVGIRVRPSRICIGVRPDVAVVVLKIDGGQKDYSSQVGLRAMYIVQ